MRLRDRILVDARRIAGLVKHVDTLQIKVAKLTAEREEARTQAIKCMNACQGLILPNDWSIEPYRIISSWYSPVVKKCDS